MKRFFQIVGIILIVLVLLAIYVRREATGEPRRFLEVIHGYVSLIDDYTRLAKDPSAAGVAASLGAKEVAEKNLPPQEAIAYFEDLLPRATDPAVKRSIRLQLSELYKQAGNHQAALDQYRHLMLGSEATTQPAGQ